MLNSLLASMPFQPGFGHRALSPGCRGNHLFKSLSLPLAGESSLIVLRPLENLSLRMQAFQLDRVSLSSLSVQLGLLIWGWVTLN